jgi:hypothetical protein
MIIYPHSNSRQKKAIYFDNEGHVINYNIDLADSSIIFTSEKSANSPMFRLTYYRLGEKTVRTTFEISPDGKKFMTYIEGKSTKIN